jgi:hypothetical protein
MAPTNALVDQLNTTITERLLDTGHLDPDQRIEIGGCVFYPGHAVVTRTNDRRLTYGTDSEEWVRNGDRTNTKQLYVGVTRGRRANHIHTAPPAFDPDHGPGTDDGNSASCSRHQNRASTIKTRPHVNEPPTSQAGSETSPPDAPKGSAESDLGLKPNNMIGPTAPQRPRTDRKNTCRSRTGMQAGVRCRYGRSSTSLRGASGESSAGPIDRGFIVAVVPIPTAFAAFHSPGHRRFRTMRTDAKRAERY